MRVIREHELYIAYGGTQTILLDPAAQILEVDVSNGQTTLVVMEDLGASQRPRRFRAYSNGSTIEDDVMAAGLSFHVASYQLPGSIRMHLFEVPYLQD